MAGIALKNLIDRYVAVWSEPDPERRRAAVRGLWSTGGVHVLQPPQEMRQVAEGCGDVAGVGLEILILDADGRIASDYQFIEG